MTPELPRASLTVPAVLSVIFLGVWVLLSVLSFRIAGPIASVADEAQVALGLDLSRGERAR